MSKLPGPLLSSYEDVVRCIVTYADWWQPQTSSVLQVPVRSSNEHRDGLNKRLVETLDERTELARRMQDLDARDRRLLFLWYVRQLHIDDVAKDIGVSRRQCFRLRTQAIRALATPSTTGQAPN